MKCLATCQTPTNFSIFYETNEAVYNFMSIFKNNVWRITFDFDPKSLIRVSFDEKYKMFNIMIEKFLEKHVFPKKLIISISGITRNIIYDFCKNHKYKMISQSHKTVLDINYQDKNLFVLIKNK